PRLPAGKSLTWTLGLTNSGPGAVAHTLTFKFYASPKDTVLDPGDPVLRTVKRKITIPAGGPSFPRVFNLTVPIPLPKSLTTGRYALLATVTAPFLELYPDDNFAYSRSFMLTSAAKPPSAAIRLATGRLPRT